MSSPPQWQYDPTRKEHYYWDPVGQAYVYQSGRIVRVAAPQQQAGPSQQPAANQNNQSNQNIPRTLSGQGAGGGSNDPTAQLQFSNLNIGQPAAGPSNPYPSNYATSNTPYPYAPASSYGGATSGFGYSYQHGQSTTGQGAGGQRWQQQGQATEPSVYNVGFKPLKIPNLGTPNALHASFVIQKNPKKFFKVGKVFKIMWPELAGRVNDNITVITANTKFAGEQIATKIRWFVVVKEGGDSCSCLPIMTYGGQGCAKRGVIKWQHAIAFSGRTEPDQQKSEKPGVQERGMLKSIRVNAKSRQDKLDVLSRINFAKIYTVEHNVKVYDFGNVHEKSLHRLNRQWVYVLERDSDGKVVLDLGSRRNPEVEAAAQAATQPTGYQAVANRAAPPDDEESDEEDDDEEDDDEEEEEEEEEETQTGHRVQWRRGT